MRTNVRINEMASSNNTSNNEKLTPSVEETLLNESGSIARVKSFS